MGSNKYIITKIKCWPVFKQDPQCHAPMAWHSLTQLMFLSQKIGFVPALFPLMLWKNAFEICICLSLVRKDWFITCFIGILIFEAQIHAS